MNLEHLFRLQVTAKKKRKLANKETSLAAEDPSPSAGMQIPGRQQGHPHQSRKESLTSTSDPRQKECHMTSQAGVKIPRDSFARPCEKSLPT